MNTATLALTDILRKLAEEGTHIAIVDGQRFLVIAGTAADAEHPYAVALAVNADNEPTCNKLTSLTTEGQTPRRTWRQSPPVCRRLSLGDLIAMAEATYGNSDHHGGLRRCVDFAIMSAWHNGVHPDILDILFFMQGALDSGDLAQHEHTSTKQIARIEAWLEKPDLATIQFYLAECLTARLAIRIAKRNAKQLAAANS